MSSEPSSTAQNQKPILFCISAPTAGGKSTLCSMLTERDNRIRRSLSTTTREPRDGETDGVHYRFVGHEEFERRVQGGSFLEHATYGIHRYGTEKENITQAEQDGVDLLLAIDIEGVKNLKLLYPKQVVTIFLFPPSFSELVSRLRKRGSEDVQDQQRRLAIARREIEVLSADGFSDYLLINDDLELAVNQATAIITAERLRMSRYQQQYLDRLFQSGS